VGAYQCLDALGDPTRRAIFDRLRRGPRAVGELARELPISRPAVSQHLRVLKEAGLVYDEADGARRLYRIAPDGSPSCASTSKLLGRGPRRLQAAPSQTLRNEEEETLREEEEEEGDG
jgi:DNA-binding transcriptional ArsR family regulator